ncbi:MAG: NYN domain-containing protein [Gemmataceae bacterium]|nr:NYN domain-containing protein [Gemmataceae bacterium]MCI0740330.1 NYN domain-containing protein [Gemmataceae bacterium]
MAAYFLIDGYNLLFAMGVLDGKLGPRGLEQARLRLLGLLAGSFGEASNLVTIVFDSAQSPPGSTQEHEYKGLRVRFGSNEQEADDLIEELIAHHSAPKSLCVVSDDRRLQTAARRKGAAPMACAAFLDYLDDIRKKAKPAEVREQEKPRRLSDKEISGWLQEFAGLEDDPDLKETWENWPPTSPLS